MPQSIFYLFDLFKTSINLRIHGKSAVSTNFGFFLTLCILFILALVGSQNDLFSRGSPRLLISNTPLETAPFVNFNKKVIAVGVEFDGNMSGFIDPTIFQIKINNYALQSLKNGTGFEIQNEDKSFHICTESDFAGKEVFKNIGLSNHFCVDDNNFALEGNYGESLISYGSARLLLCNNQTSNFTCKSFDEMKDTLNGMSFNVYYMNTMFQSGDHENPLKYEVVNEYKTIDILFRKDIELYFQKISVYSDDGMLFKNISIYEDLIYDYQRVDINSVDENDFESPRVCFYFFSMKKRQSISRVYEKLTDVLASLGGISNALFVMGSILVSVDHRFFLRKIVVNSLYNIKSSNKNKRPNHLPDFTKKNKEIGNDFETSKLNQNKRNIIRKILVNILSFFSRGNPQRQIKNYDNFHRGFWSYFLFLVKSSIPFFNKKLNLGEKIMEKAEELFENELDLVEILKRLQQIEKLKKILLDDKQMHLFKFLGKSKIDLRKEFDETKKNSNSLSSGGDQKGTLKNSQPKKNISFKKILDSENVYQHEI